MTRCQSGRIRTSASRFAHGRHGTAWAILEVPSSRSAPRRSDGRRVRREVGPEPGRRLVPRVVDRWWRRRRLGTVHRSRTVEPVLSRDGTCRRFGLLHRRCVLRVRRGLVGRLLRRPSSSASTARGRPLRSVEQTCFPAPGPNAALCPSEPVCDSRGRRVRAPGPRLLLRTRAVCSCGVPSELDALDAGREWACGPNPGCPGARPRLGAPCTAIRSASTTTHPDSPRSARAGLGASANVGD